MTLVVVVMSWVGGRGDHWVLISVGMLLLRGVILAIRVGVGRGSSVRSHSPSAWSVRRRITLVAPPMRIVLLVWWGRVTMVRVPIAVASMIALVVLLLFVVWGSVVIVVRRVLMRL